MHENMLSLTSTQMDTRIVRHRLFGSIEALQTYHGAGGENEPDTAAIHRLEADRATTGNDLDVIRNIVFTGDQNPETVGEFQKQIGAHAVLHRIKSPAQVLPLLNYLQRLLNDLDQGISAAQRTAIEFFDRSTAASSIKFARTLRTPLLSLGNAVRPPSMFDEYLATVCSPRASADARRLLERNNPVPANASPATVSSTHFNGKLLYFKLSPAIDHFAAAASGGNLEAAVELARLLTTRNSIGDRQEALAILERITNQRESATIADLTFPIPRAHFELAEAYLAGIGTAPSQFKAEREFVQSAAFARSSVRWREYLQSWADSGRLSEKYVLGLMLLRSPRRTPAMEEEALQYVMDAAFNGHVLAQELLGQLAERGIGFQKDRKLAIQCYRAAASRGNPSAAAKLGNWYLRGFNVHQNIHIASAYFSIAADAGDQGRAIILTQLHEAARANSGTVS